MTKINTEPGKENSVESEIQRIPNGVHLYRIREALSKGHAAVMIGSGFSRNAQGGKRLPVWDGLIDALLADIYTSAEARSDARKRLGGISGMLRLAEEYAAVRGRAQLDARMHELLPDAGVVMPGDLHTKLLSLNWSDVYTTNYDTLLERALDTDRREFNPEIDRRYQVVVAANDVPFSKTNGRPRVVKLHGSLRTGSRLIVTEDDYRAYPTDFAPFVNMVQQAMLENVFCLIGFSGDDPNFLLWTGWVRDRLGGKSPPIYLITLKAASEGERLILERRNVFPINIASLGSLDGKADHAASLNALLDFWKDKPPPRQANWPFHKPASELKPTGTDIDNLVGWTTLAQQNRKEYPGWLVAPTDNRSRLAASSATWKVIFAYRKLPANTPRWFRVVILTEVLWILETVFDFPTSQVAGDIAELLRLKLLLDKYPPMEQFPEAGLHLKPSDRELLLHESRLLIALLKTAREDGDSTAFKRWNDVLDRKIPLSIRSPEIQCQFLYEQILVYLEERKRDAAITIIRQLELASGSDVDPYWRIRVGALLGEQQIVDRGQALVRSGLHSIRETIQAEGESAFLLSREQWAERLLDVFDFAVKEARELETRRSRRRLAAETAADAAARTLETQPPEIGLQEVVTRERSRDRPETDEAAKILRDESTLDNVEHPLFQTRLILREVEIAKAALESTSISIDAVSLPDRRAEIAIRQEAFTAAITYTRVVERAALVPSIGKVGFSAQNLATCYRILSEAGNAAACLRILYRANSGATLASAEALSLHAIAELPVSMAQSIFSRFTEEIERHIDDNDQAWDPARIASLKFALDIASRVAFRLERDQAVVLAELAIRLYGHPGLHQSTSLHRSFGSFLRRAFRLLPEPDQSGFAPRLFSSQPANGAFERVSYWPDSTEVLTELQIRPTRGGDWPATINKVLGQAEHEPQSGNEGEIAFYFRQLDWLYREKLMSAAQEHRFARLIWAGVKRHALPVVPRFYRGAALTWPKPRKRTEVAESFRAWINAEPIERIEKPTEHMGKTVMSFSGVSEALLVNVLLSVANNANFDWTEDDLLALCSKIEDWWLEEGNNLTVRAVAQGDNTIMSYLPARLRLIAHVLHRVIAPRMRRRAVEDSGADTWLQKLWEAGFLLDSPLVPLLFAGLTWWPEQSDTVIDMTISILTNHSDQQAVVAGLSAAGVWLATLPDPTETSSRYVTWLVESVRSPTCICLDLKLDSIAELLRFGCKRHFQPFKATLAVALNGLLSELQGDRPMLSQLTAATRPILRVAATALLAAMRDTLAPPSVQPAWVGAMEMAKSDRLLVVRRLVM